MYSLFDASVGTEELNHIEMVCTIVHQLTRNLTVQQIKEQGFADYYVDHTIGIYQLRQVVLHGVQIQYSPPVIQLLTLWKIWLRRVRLYKDNIEVLKESSR